MPVDRYHAFADGSAYPRPSPRLASKLAAPLARHLASLLLQVEIASVWAAFERRAEVGPGCLLGPRAWCVNPGPRDRVRLGAGVVCRGIVRREAFGDGWIEIGDRVYLGDDAIVSCSERVEIGDETLLAHGVQIFDNDSHPVGSEARQGDWRSFAGSDGRSQAIGSAPVRIGRGAWLGLGAVVLKGVTIGDGAIVGAGSVVTRDVEPGAVVVGNPAETVASRA